MPSKRAPRQYEGPGKAMDVPAIKGIGGSLIYFIDQLLRHLAL